MILYQINIQRRPKNSWFVSESHETLQRKGEKQVQSIDVLSGVVYNKMHFLMTSF